MTAVGSSSSNILGSRRAIPFDRRKLDYANVLNTVLELTFDPEKAN